MDGEAALLARLQALEDERAILALLHRTSMVVDEDVIADWVDCFVPEGRFSWTSDPAIPPLLDVRGADSLGAWLVQHRQSHPVGSQTHILVHPLVSLAGDTAEVASSYMTLKAQAAGDLVVASSGRYADSVRRCADGRWRIVERRSLGLMRRAVSAPA